MRQMEVRDERVRDRATCETRDGSGAVRRDLRLVAVHAEQTRQEVRAPDRSSFDDQHEMAVGLRFKRRVSASPTWRVTCLGQPIGGDA